jgi:hypothetical protein
MLRLAWHPLATSVICTVAALIAADGVSSTLDRQRLGFRANGPTPLVLLAIAWSQVFVSPGAVLPGAAAWSSWMASGISCVLAGLWYRQQAHANRVSH